jgi:hypothetical protein
MRLFFEAYELALRHPDRYSDFLNHAIRDWLDEPLAAIDDISATLATATVTDAVRCPASVTAQRVGHWRGKPESILRSDEPGASSIRADSGSKLTFSLLPTLIRSLHCDADLLPDDS